MELISFGEGLVASLVSAMTALLVFIPALIGALIILIVGWIIAGVVARVVETVLNRIGFQQAADRTGLSGFLGRTGAGDLKAAHVIGELVKWFIRLIFLEAAASALHLGAITSLLNQIVLFIPNLVVALVVVMVGALIAQFAARAVEGAAAEAGLGSAGVLAALARYAIIGFAVMIAVNQIGIGATLINTLFTAFVGALALAFGIAFGLGGKDTAAQIWSRIYRSGEQAASPAAPETPISTTAFTPPQPGEPHTGPGTGSL